MPLTLIAETLLVAPAASIDMASIPATYDHLILKFQMRTDKPAVTNELVSVVFNNDSANANYDKQQYQGTAAVVTTAETLATAVSRQAIEAAAATATADHFSTGKIVIPFYAGASFKNALVETSSWRSRASTGFVLGQYAMGWASVAAINRITFAPATGPNFVAGTKVSLYGLI